MNEATSSESSLSSLDTSDSKKGKALKGAANKVVRKRKATDKSIELPKKFKSVTSPLQPQPLKTNSEVFKKTASAIKAVPNVTETIEDIAQEVDKDNNIPADCTTPGKGVTNGKVN